MTPLPTVPDALRWWRALAGAWQADWRERRRDWRVWLVLGTGMLLALCAGLQTALQLQESRQARALATHAENQRWAHQGDKNPHSAAHYGMYVFKPLPTLAALDPGVEQYVGTSVWLEAHKQNELVYRPASDESGAVRQFRLTPALLLQVLAPIAMIFLGSGMFAGERERGTLPVLRVNAAPLGAVGLARAAVLVCLALVIALPACLVVAAVAALHQHGAEQPFLDAGLRASVFGAGYLLYLATWAAIITAVSAWSATTRASLGALIALWAFCTLVAPRAALELAQAAAPLPSMQAFREQLDAALGSPHDPQTEARHQQQLLDQYGVTRLADLPVNWSGISLARGEQLGNDVFDHHYGALFNQLRRQSEAAALAGWLSPAVAIAGLSGTLAASDTDSHIAFVRSAEQQRRLMQTTLNDALTRHPDQDGQRWLGDQSLWQSIPAFRFHFAPVAWRTVLLAQCLPLLTLFGASVLLALLGIRRLRHGRLR